MLVLSIRKGETIRIGDDIEITLVRTNTSSARIGIKAPRDVMILRGELDPEKYVAEKATDVLEGETND